MKARSLLAGLAAALLAALPATGADAQRPRAAVARDWTQTVVRTPEGGFRMGNPAAPVKLVEYLSLTCPHCADFAHGASAALIGRYVRSGRVSLEYRNYYLNGLDVAAAMLTRCANPRAYFDMTHSLLATQRQWMGRIESVSEAQQAEYGRMQPLQIAQRLIPVLGLDAIGARHGITPRARQACINQANLAGLDRLRAGGSRLGVQGTPTFFINGRRLDTNSWAGIEPLLQGGGRP